MTVETPVSCQEAGLPAPSSWADQAPSPRRASRLSDELPAEKTFSGPKTKPLAFFPGCAKVSAVT
jgi:hypothetical protein